MPTQGRKRLIKILKIGDCRASGVGRRRLAAKAEEATVGRLDQNGRSSAKAVIVVKPPVSTKQFYGTKAAMILATACNAFSGVESYWARTIAPSIATAKAIDNSSRLTDAGSKSIMTAIMSSLWRRAISTTSGKSLASSPTVLTKAQPRNSSFRNHSAKVGTRA